MADGTIDDMSTAQVRNLDIGYDKELDALKSPRVLHTHMIPQLLPKDAFKGGPKIVLLFRNPKDTAVSLYNFLQTETNLWSPLQISWDRFLGHWMEKSCKLL